VRVGSYAPKLSAWLAPLGAGLSALWPRFAGAQEAVAQTGFTPTTAENVIFYLLAAVTVAMALSVILRKNPLHGALSLVVSFFSLAGIYILLYAHLLAVMQVLVYAGAIMVLFTFVIMLLNLQERELGEPRGVFQKSLAVGVVTFLAVGVIVAVKPAVVGNFLEAPSLSAQAGALPATYGSVEGVGGALFRDFMLPFELVSVLLLVAIVGAVAVAKKRI
jgi:NADH-quinone oxidoreductase subunit J